MSSKNIKGITIEINGNTAPLQKALQAVNTKTVSLNSELKEINRSLKFDPTNTTLLAQKQKVLSNAVGTTAEKLKVLKNAQAQVQAQFDRGEINEEQYRAYQREIQKTTQSMRSYEMQLKETAVAQAQMSAAAQKLYMQLDRVATVGLTATTVTLGIIAVAAKKTEEALLSLADAGGEYEKVVSKINTLDLAASAQKIQTISKQVLQTSTITGEAAENTAEATYQMASAVGQLKDNVGDYVLVATKAAIGGFTDTETAVNGLSTAMNAYGDQSVEAMQKYSDQMLIAQNVGKTTFGEIAASMGSVIPLAAAVNMASGELFATYAVLTKNGIETAESTTAVKAALSNIIKPSAEAAALAKELGIEFDATALQSKGLQGVLNDVMEATNGDVSSLAKLFGSVKALNAVMVLTSEQGAADMTNAMAAMEASSGATEAAFEKMSDTYDTQKNKMIVAADNLKIAWGTKLKASAVNAFKAISSGIEKLSTTKNEKAIEKMGEAFESLTTKAVDFAVKAIPKIIDAMSWMAKNGQKITSVVLSLTAAFAALKVSIAIQKAIQGVTVALAAYKAVQAASTVATGAATTAQLGLNAAMMANPIGLVATALAVLVAGLVTYSATSGQAKTATEELDEEYKQLKESIAASSQEHAEALDELANETIATSSLVHRLEVLTSKSRLSAAQQAELEAIVAKLNESNEGLNLTYDAQTGILSGTIQSVKEYTEAKYKEAVINELTERAIELLGKQAEAEKLLHERGEARRVAWEAQAKAEKAYTDARERGASLAELGLLGDDYLAASESFSYADAAMNDAIDTFKESNQAVADNQAEMEGLIETTDGYTESITAAAEEVERFTYNGYDLQNLLDETGLSADEAQAKIDAYAETAQNAFEKLKSTVNLTASEMTSNLLSNQHLLAEWSENMSILESRTTSAGEKIDSGFIETLREMGVTAAGTVENLANANQADFDALASAWESGGDTAVQALLTEMGAGQTDIQAAGEQAIQDAIDGVEGKGEELNAAVTKVIDDAQASAGTAVTNANFGGVGYQISAGIAAGIKSGQSVINQAIDDAIEAAVARAKDKALISSPSKLFADEVGFDIGRGIGLGIPRAINYINSMIGQTLDNVVGTAKAQANSKTTSGNQTGLMLNFNQQIYSHDSLSASEISDETQAGIARMYDQARGRI